MDIVIFVIITLHKFLHSNCGLNFNVELFAMVAPQKLDWSKATHSIHL